MRQSFTVLLLALVLIPSVVHAGIITVDCNGSADFTDLRLAILSAGVGDTVLVSPCVYFADPGYPPGYTLWPVELHDESPAIVSTDGPEVTVIEGDGTITPFVVSHVALCARVHIEGFTIRNVESPVVWDDNWGGDVMFRGNIVENTSYGIFLWACHGEVSGNVFRHIPSRAIGSNYFIGPIEYNEIYDCGTGIGWVSNRDHAPIVRGNYVHNNAGTGLQGTFSARIEDNIIEDNLYSGISCGLVYHDDNSIIQGNVVRRNRWGITLDGLDCPIRQNDIYSNDEFDLRLTSGYWGVPVVDVTENWWGTTDPSLIAAHIWDCYDDPEVSGCVDFDPWCSEPGCSSTPVCKMSWGSIKAIFRE